MQRGESERIVGKALSGRRDQIVLATKAGEQVSSGPFGSGLSRKHVIAEAEASLKRLGTDYIDIYYMHKPDPHTPVGETLGAFSDLVRAGKVRYVGMSNYAAWQVGEALYQSRQRGLSEPVVSQQVYNLITRGIETEFLPFAKTYQRATVIYNPLAGGFLTGKHKRGAPSVNTRFSLKKSYEDRYWNGRNFDAVDELMAIADRAGMTIAEMALRFCLRDGIDSVLIGFSGEKQLLQNIKNAEGGGLPADVAVECDRVWRDFDRKPFFVYQIMDLQIPRCII